MDLNGCTTLTITDTTELVTLVENTEPVVFVLGSPITTPSVGSLNPYVIQVPSASASWIVANPTSRAECIVKTYIGGIEVEADVVTSASTITVTWSSPVAGYIIVI